MIRRLIVGALGVGLFAFSTAVLTVSAVALTATPVEAAPCTPCHSITLNCDGSVCKCEWGGASYGCVPMM